MRTTSRRCRNAGRLARVVVACVATTACTSKGPDKADTGNGAATSPSPADSATQAAAPAEAAYKPLGSLPQSLDYMLQHPDELKKLVGPDNAYTGNFADRNCEGCKTTEKTKVHVGAISDSWRVDYKALPANGVIVGRMTNYGKKNEELYHLLPNETFYILWGGDGSPDARMRLIRRIDKPGQSTRFELVKGFTRIVQDCVGHPKTLKPNADFADCSDDAKLKGGIGVLSPSKGVWMSCSQGCCTADAGPLDKGVGTQPADSTSRRARSAPDSSKS